MVRYLTPEGLEKLKKELEYLEKVERRKIAKALKELIAQGDLSENAAYQITKENQVLLEKKIQELKEIINNAQILEKPKGDVVGIGSFVYLKSKKNKLKVQIVYPEEADFLNGKISFKSPLGSALLNKKKGEIVTIETPDEKEQYKIIEVK